MIFKKLLNRFSLKIAKREIEDYSRKVSMGNSEQHGIILGHALLIFAQLVKKLPEAKNAIETKDDVYKKELADLVLQTNSLLKEYWSCGDKLNAAGVKLWNETFRCLSHPELTHYGMVIWSYFSKAQKNAVEYLDVLEDKFVNQKDNDMITKIREAREFLYIIPNRFMKSDQ